MVGRRAARGHVLNRRGGPLQAADQRGVRGEKGLPANGGGPNQGVAESG